MIRDASHRLPGALFKTIARLTLISLLCAPVVVRAQDAVRPSLAGEEAAEARRQDVDRLPYNLMLGPVRFRVSATVGVEYNDNINLSDDDTAVFHIPGGGHIVVRSEPQDDVIIRPQLNIDALWPVTQ